MAECGGRAFTEVNKVKWIIAVVQYLSRVRLFVTPWTAASQASCPSPSPRACSNSCPLGQSCLPIVSSSVTLFSSSLQSFPASGSFPMSWLFASGGQRIGVSVSVLPMNIQDLFPLGLLVWPLCSSRDSQESSPTPQFKSSNSLVLSNPYSSPLTSIHDYGKNHSFDYTDLCWQMMSLFFNMLSRLSIAFLPRGKHLWISWLQSPSAVILEPKKIKFPFFPYLFAMKWWDVMILVFIMLSF